MAKKEYKNRKIRWNRQKVSEKFKKIDIFVEKMFPLKG